MKSSNAFKRTIQEYLDNKASRSDAFKAKYINESKNIDDCITFILNTVKKSGNNGFTDNEIFGMAIHYYDQENIEVGKPISSQVVVNHKVELTEEEIADAKKEAIQKIQDEVYKKATQAPKKTIVKKVESISLFDEAEN